jgi:hypothetical protein
MARVAPDEAASRPVDPRDFSGIWMNDNTLDERLKREGRTRLDPSEVRTPSGDPNVALLRDEYRAIYEDRQAELAALEEGVARCEWPGMPRIMTYPYPLEILHTPGRVTMIFEAESQVRRIFLERAEHLPEDELDPSYNGDSIGWWEGDTLVVDTVGFHLETSVGRGLPHSEQMRIRERIGYVDADTIHVEMTIHDPLALTAPIEQTIVYSKRPEWRIREYSCMENNRDAPDAEGRRSGGVVDQGGSHAP